MDLSLDSFSNPKIWLILAIIGVIIMIAGGMYIASIIIGMGAGLTAMFQLGNNGSVPVHKEKKTLGGNQ